MRADDQPASSVPPPVMRARVAWKGQTWFACPHRRLVKKGIESAVALRAYDVVRNNLLDVVCVNNTAAATKSVRLNTNTKARL